MDLNGDGDKLEEEKCAKFGRRNILPVAQFSRGDYSVWTLLKQFIGKDLTKMTVPVIFSEPLSFLQRLCEYTEYSSLLDQAAVCDDKMERMLLVGAFVVSATASHVDRPGKPFNPLLGETFEFCPPGLNYRMVCEQVSHHPPVSAYDADSDHWHFYGTLQPKIKCWGNSLEVVPNNTATLHLKTYGETYTWNAISAHIHNILIGKMWIEQYGPLVITNRTNGFSLTLNYLQSSGSNKELHKVNGFLLDQSGKKLKALFGKWTESLYSTDLATFQNMQQSASISPRSLSDCQLLWQLNSRPVYSPQYFGFTLMAMAFNEINEDKTGGHFAPTDSRFRPDIRALENGSLDQATVQKNRLEDKQRETIKKSKVTGKDGGRQPAWFKLQKGTVNERDEWRFTGDYWKRHWSSCPSIF